MTNLATSVLDKLREHNKTLADVLWAGSEDFGFMFPDDFRLAASNFNFDSGFGGQECPSDLVVVGDDWWLERREYDGSEWWEFKQLPVRPERLLDHKTIRFRYESDTWFTLQEANQVGGKYS